MNTFAIGHNTIYRQATENVSQAWAQQDAYSMKELDDIYFKKPVTEVQRERAQGIIHINACQIDTSCGIGSGGARFESKSDFLKDLNELLTWAPKEGLRKRYTSLIKKGQKQDYVDLSLLKKMDGHLEWALKKNDIRADAKKEEIDEHVARIIRSNKKIETQAQIDAKEMGKRLLHQMNKKVAGRVEGIDKVERYLNQQQKWEDAEAEAAKIVEEEDEEDSEPETPIFQKCTGIKKSNFQITPMQTPHMAAYQQKQLRYMNVDHIKMGRNSDFTTANRRSEMTTAANSYNKSINLDDDEMPFATANTVKHTKKKSLMLAAESMLSPKSMMRRDSVLAEPTSDDLELANKTSCSNRMRQLDRTIEDHVNQLTRPKVSRERDQCFSTLEKGLKDKYNHHRRNNLFGSERSSFDLKLTHERHSSFCKNTMEAHHLHNKFSDKMKKRLNDSPLRRMKQLQQDQYQQIQNNLLNMEDPFSRNGKQKL